MRHQFGTQNINILHSKKFRMNKYRLECWTLGIIIPTLLQKYNTTNFRERHSDNSRHSPTKMTQILQHTLKVSVHKNRLIFVPVFLFFYNCFCSEVSQLYFISSD